MERRDVLKGLGAAATLAGAGWWEGHTEVGNEPAVLLNQVGYRPSEAKLVTVRGVAAGAKWRVVPAAGGQPVAQGVLSPERVDAASGDRVALADLSVIRAPGSYLLMVDGLPPTGEQVVVGDDTHALVLRTAMRGFYGQRCGCAVDLGGGYQHPPCHAAGAYHATSGRSGSVANHGGWHDAGDYGRYVVNSGISTGTLLWAWELYPAALEGLALGIPESGGRLPDFLAEVRWNLDWMLSLQDGDGGVWQKQTSEHFCAFIMPQDDTLVSYVIGTGSAPYKNTTATADLAAVAAIAARCYRRYDAEYAEKCLLAARKAYSWAVAHPDVLFQNPPGIGTGGYGDKDASDELLWAAAELWRTTGEERYGNTFMAAAGPRLHPYLVSEQTLGEPSWSNLLPMAFWTYAMAPKCEPAFREQVATVTGRAAAALAARGGASGYGQTLDLNDYIWGSNSVAANQSMLLLMAVELGGGGQFHDAAVANLHYLLGRNCFGVSWVTAVGTKPFQHPHHRPSVADGIAAPWPGLMSGGPNARGGDKVADALPKRLPMRMWVDNDQAYSLNEIAINWNAPLVFLLAAATSGSSRAQTGIR